MTDARAAYVCVPVRLVEDGAYDCSHRRIGFGSDWGIINCTCGARWRFVGHPSKIPAPDTVPTPPQSVFNMEKSE